LHPSGGKRANCCLFCVKSGFEVRIVLALAASFRSRTDLHTESLCSFFEELCVKSYFSSDAPVNIIAVIAGIDGNSTVFGDSVTLDGKTVSTAMDLSNLDVEFSWQATFAGWLAENHADSVTVKSKSTESLPDSLDGFSVTLGRAIFGGLMFGGDAEYKLALVGVADKTIDVKDDQLLEQNVVSKGDLA
jgi:hypothetical protein